MFTQRAVQQSMRRLAAQQPTRSALSKFAAPAAVATNTHYIQRRQVTQNTPETEANSILIQQRLNRPVSPHLAIYRPQITWYGSALNRITGSILSGGLYIFGATYLIAPVMGWHLETASIAAAFASWPAAAKILTKAFLAFPFTFHSFNGIRHLIWDFGKQINNRQVQVTGWTVVGLSVVSTLALAVF